MQTHDLIGIGFGPSNIALAIALSEAGPNERKLDAVFLEKQASFSWHKGMILDQAHMQISYLKDLATLRNPTSHFTFVNYLHEKGRLSDFINMKNFNPSRREFNDYLTWAARQFDHACVYGEEVFEVLPERQGDTISLLRVRSRNSAGKVTERLARNLVVSVGGTTKIPECFLPLRNDPRVFHSHTYLHNIGQHAHAQRIAIVGAGQSAAEIFMDLQGRPGAPQIDLITRGRAIHPSDDSPFVNEVFNVDFTDYMYHRPGATQAALLDQFRHTNYSVADQDLIQQIFKVFYEQKVASTERLRFLRGHDINAVRADQAGVHLTLTEQDTGVQNSVRYDAVILATGYQRSQHKPLLTHLAPYFSNDAVDRHYRLQSTSNFSPTVFLQGESEATHGLSDTLLSVTAVRTGEIRAALFSGAADNAAPLRRTNAMDEELVRA